MAKAKTHSIFVRGVRKEEKNSLKRIVKQSPSFTTVNQLVLSLIELKTAPEIAEYQQSKKKI